MKFIATCMLALVLSFSPAKAQTSSGSVTITLLKVEGLVVGSRYDIDQEFAQKFNIPVPAPFKFIAPRNKAQKIYRKEAPGGSGIIKLFFTTQEDDVQSHIQFVPFTIEMGAVEFRLAGMEKVVKEVFLSSVTDKDAARVNFLRKIMIGDLPALELIGNYKDPNDGIIIRRIVAIPHPENENGVVAIINALVRHLRMKKAEDILNSSASRALGTFDFSP